MEQEKELLFMNNPYRMQCTMKPLPDVKLTYYSRILRVLLAKNAIQVQF